MKIIGKLQDGTIFLKKGHGDGEELFEFKTDEGNGGHVVCFYLYLLWFDYASKPKVHGDEQSKLLRVSTELS